MPSSSHLFWTSLASAVIISTTRGFRVTPSSTTFLFPRSTVFRHLSTKATTSTTTRATTVSWNMESSTTTTTTRDGSGGLFLFDFDGVVCDSCDECTVSSLRTCQQLGVLPTDNDNNDDCPSKLEYPPDWLFQKMRELRPAIEFGWQIPVMLSIFLEQQQQQGGSRSQNAMSVDDIIKNYETLVSQWLQKHSKTETEMIDAFGNVRDEWIQNDLNSWLDINTFYKGVPDALSNCKGQGVLVTTKQQRFAIALCRHAGIRTESLPDEQIYGLGQYKKKADVIVDHMKSGNYKPDQTHFFEDRWPTLAKCLKDDRLNGVRLHLCKWGYVTKEELALAEAEPRVQVIGLEDFSRIVSS